MNHEDKISMCDCPFAYKYNHTWMCMDYVIPCFQNIKRGKCGWSHMRNMIDQKLQGMLHGQILFEQMTDRILYGWDLKYAPARHLVKGVKSYGNANLPRAGLCIKNFGEVKKK